MDIHMKVQLFTNKLMVCIDYSNRLFFSYTNLATYLVLSFPDANVRTNKVQKLLPCHHLTCMSYSLPSSLRPKSLLP